MDTDTVERYAFLSYEFDGKIPPTTWYNRLHRLGLVVRGDKEVSPLARRMAAGSAYRSRHSVIIQEGTILCESEDQAHILGELAEELGARNVYVGFLEISKLKMSERDHTALENVRKILGKRGRPDPDKNLVVTCHNCGGTAEYTGRPRANCPVCGSFQVTSREGNQVKATLDPSKSVADNWFYSRFSAKVYERPIYDAEYPLPSFDPNQVETKIRAQVANLMKSKLAKSILFALKRSKIDMHTACRYLDAGYLALEKSEEERFNARVFTLAQWVKSGHKIDNIEFAPPAGEIDVFDIAGSERSAPGDLL